MGKYWRTIISPLTGYKNKFRKFVTNFVYSGRCNAIYLHKRFVSNLGLIIFNKHVGLILGLTFFVILANIGQSKANDQQFITTSTDETVKVAMSVSPYTDLIQEDSTTLKMAIDGTDANFIHKPVINETEQTPSTYIVARGDTISSIAQQFNVTIATVLDANNIKPEDIAKISVGTQLIIPAQSTSDSLEWLNQINANKAKALEESRNLASRTSQSTNRTSSASHPITSGHGSDGFIVPIRSKGISRGIGDGHEGIDYRADVGTPVWASSNGRVIKVTSGWAGGFGNSVLIDHGNGVTTRYAHLSKAIVRVGQTVSQGQIIAYSGNTGNSTGPHLHFQMNINGKVADPYTMRIVNPNL